MQDTPGLVRSYPVLSLTWMSMRLLHLWLRYQSLSALQFNTVQCYVCSSFFNVNFMLDFEDPFVQRVDEIQF